ncbi:hypothetical protein AGLY_011073 [Aphis glycines]|uniref:Uncharacterized protein n=1 Tax=Aphis glycines TaxID=307491 RepID=A0A6G0TEJ7_APHGL|nr:hypothetical protein AGLY_011073 [Aphis glycines]
MLSSVDFSQYNFTRLWIKFRNFCSSFIKDWITQCHINILAGEFNSIAGYWIYTYGEKKQQEQFISEYFPIILIHGILNTMLEVTSGYGLILYFFCKRINAILCGVWTVEITITEFYSMMDYDQQTNRPSHNYREYISRKPLDVIRRMFVDYDTSICSMKLIMVTWRKKYDNQRDYKITVHE